MAIADFDKCVLLLPMSGANNGTVFTDYSSKQRTVTLVGDVKTVTSSSTYGSSGSFDGSGDYLTFSDSDDFYFSGDFCIKTKLTLSAQPVQGTGNSSMMMLWSQRATDSSRIFLGYADFIGNTSGPGLWFQIDNGASSFQLIKNQLLSTGTEYDIEIDRSGNLFTLRINGITATTATSSISMPNVAAQPTIGYGWAGAFYLNGKMNDFLIMKGTALYSGDFTPSTLMKSISGTVKDDTNTGTIRTVRAYPRSTGLPMASTTSAADGTFSLTVPDVEHTVIALDDTAGNVYNDIVVRVTPG